LILSRTPFRVSFFGGGTDYAPWFREHGGAVLTATIRRYCNITCRPLDPLLSFRSRIVWSRIELVDRHEEIAHPVVRAVFEHRRIRRGVELHHDGELPARSGLGTSSAFTIGLLRAIGALEGWEDPSPAELAREAILIERGLLAEHGGIQDPIQIAHGGLNRIVIARDGTFAVEPLSLTEARRRALASRLALCFLGSTRDSSAAARATEASIPERAPELRRLRALVDEGVAALVDERADLDGFGELLHEGWVVKRRLSEVISSSGIDEIYARGRNAGAVGGKLLGAGGGGFMLFYVRPEEREKLGRALAPLPLLPVEFELEGPRVVRFA
jgi:D-glycero-alpha-D-manno-heptose-7-phosphate kinase